jgi:hypothetical protein
MRELEVHDALAGAIPVGQVVGEDCKVRACKRDCCAAEPVGSVSR